MSQRIKAITFRDVDEIEIDEFELGHCGPTDIVVRTHYTMVSSGTELRVLAGHCGARENFPLIPGYASVGEVIAVGAEADGFRVGDRVSCRNPKAVPGINARWGGQASVQVHVTSGEDRAVLLPAEGDLADYVVAEVSANSLRGVEDRQKAIEQFRRGTLKASDFIGSMRPFTEAPAAYAALRDDKESNFSLAFDWTGA